MTSLVSVSNTTGKLEGLALIKSGIVERMDCKWVNSEASKLLVSSAGVAMKADGQSEVRDRRVSKFWVTLFLVDVGPAEDPDPSRWKR